MKYFSTEEIGRVFVLRLDQGDMVLESINQLIADEGIKDAVVVSGIGTLDKCTLHMVMTQVIHRWNILNAGTMCRWN